MKIFMKTVCIKESIWDNESYDYDDVAFGDYVVFALWDITNPDNPSLIMCDDNTHTSITSDIDSFIDGVKYVEEEVTFIKDKILICKESDYKPNLLTDRLI